MLTNISSLKLGSTLESMLDSLAIFFFTIQVLVQGWRVTKDNVGEFLDAIVKQLELLEDTIADVSGLVHDEIENVRLRQVSFFITICFQIKYYIF